jgi:hypothetical protein
VNNNPVRYNDPTGHQIDEGEGGGCSNPVNGRCPTPDAIVHAGLEVQGEFFNTFLDDSKWFHGPSTGYGEANAYEEELQGRDPMDPAVAEEIIKERIYNAIRMCKSKGLCQNETDYFIIAALAQNGLFPHGWLHIPSLPTNSQGGIDWAKVMNDQGKVPITNIQYPRQLISGMNFNTEFQLYLFTYNVRSLMSNGYILSEDFDEVNWAVINNLLGQ